MRAGMLPPPVNNTGRMNCGVSGSESSGRECDLTPQPCYYVVTVGTVFKGNYTVSEVYVPTYMYIIHNKGYWLS